MRKLYRVMGHTRDPLRAVGNSDLEEEEEGGGEPSEMEVVAERRGDAGGVTCRSVV
jgi:hypothetical protein